MVETEHAAATPAKAVSLMKPRWGEQMINDEAPSPERDELRNRAEERLAEKGLQGGIAHGEGDTRRLLQELQVHQVELEMQNEELQQSRQALEASLEHYTDLYDFAQLGYFTLDGSGVIREINLAGIALLERFRSQVLGKRFAAFLSPDSRAAFNDFLERISGGRTKQSWTVELVSEGSERGVRHLHIEGAPVFWPEEGSSRAVAGAVRLAALDVTERKRTEDALRQSEERYRLLVESANEGIVVEQDGLLKFVNASLLDITGYSAEDFASRPFMGYVHPEDRAAILDHLQRTLKGEKAPTGCAFRILNKQGQVKWLHSNSVGIEWEDRPATLNLFTDITERKRAEEEKARPEAQLRHAQKMEAVGTLTVGIAHEFNNLLAAILGFAEMARYQRIKREDNPTEIDQIVTAANRAQALLRQMLIFSRKPRGDNKPLNINNSVTHSVKMLERTLPGTISIETRLSYDLPPIEGDRSQLDQVLINLATHARDALPEGGKLSISTELVSMPDTVCNACGGKFYGDYVLVSVTGTGQEVGKGEGLDLSVVLGLVHDHGGHVKYESKPGVGTTFEVYLPICHEGVVDEATQPPQDRALEGSEIILLADDEESMLSLGGKYLGLAGYQVLATQHGEEALEFYRARAGEIALVVLDLGMPGMGGQRYMKEILALNPKAKVVIASGYADNEQVNAFLESGARGCVAKPFNRPDLLATVRRVLDGG
jgi:PAS domain S-box-containing protein